MPIGAPQPQKVPGLYPGEQNLRFHVLADPDVFDATPAAHAWLDRQRERERKEERERIIALIDQSETFYLADKFGVYAEAKIREALTPKG